MPASPAAGRAPSRSLARGAARTTVRTVAVAAVCALAWYAAFTLVPGPRTHGFFDLRVYRGAVVSWLDGGALYSFHLADTRYGFTYPPFAALVMVPLAWLGQWTAAVLTVLGSVVVVAFTTRWLVLPVARRHGWSPWFVVALVVPVVLALDPIRLTLAYGQVNMLVLALVLADAVALRPDRAWAGAGIGLATAIKVTPGLFVVLLVLTGRRRPAVVAVGTFLGATLLGFAVDPAASWQYWTSALWDTSRVGRLDQPSNQSILGLLAHLAAPGQPDHRVWAVLAGAVLVVGMWRAVRAHRHGDDLVAVTLVGLTACLVSPITWRHHLYWAVPALAVLFDLAAGTPLPGTAPDRVRQHPGAVAVGAGLLVLAVTVAFLLAIPSDFGAAAGVPPSRSPVDVLGRSAYTVITLALLVLLPVRGTARVGEPRLSGTAPGVVRRRGRSRPGGWSPR